eukprot:gene563-792_t
MSLEEFILVPFKKTVTDYPVPNNHIFFSLLMNGWLKLWGIHTFAEAVQSIWVVRLLPALFSSAALFTVAATVNRATKQRWGVVGMVSLMAMLPFYNYATQAGSLLPNPQSNVGCMGKSVAGTMCLWTLAKEGFKQAVNSVHAKAPLFVGSGVVVAILLYLPVFKQVISNDYVKSAGMFRVEIWCEALQILKYLLKPYFISLITIVWGLWFAVAKKADMRVVVVLAVVIA